MDPIEFLRSIVTVKNKGKLEKWLETVTISPKMVPMTIMYNNMPIKTEVPHGSGTEEIVAHASYTLGFPVAINSFENGVIRINDVPSHAFHEFTTKIYTYNRRKLEQIYPRPIIDNIIPKLRVRNPDLYRAALTHKTMHKFYGVDYERLEFLGDRVIEIIVLGHLLERYGSKVSEGTLTKLLNNYTCTTPLNIMGQALGLDKLIQYGPTIEVVTPGIVEDSFEAFFGAMYLDCHGDLDYIASFLLPLYKYVSDDILHTNDNYKEILQQWVQDKDNSTKIPQYREWYKVIYEVDNESVTAESWFSLDDAKNRAAHQYLVQVGVESGGFKPGVRYFQSFVAYLNQHGKRYRYVPQQNFKCKCILYMPNGGGEIEAIGESQNTNKESHQNAALIHLRGNKVKIPRLI